LGGRVFYGMEDLECAKVSEVRKWNRGEEVEKFERV